MDNTSKKLFKTAAFGGFNREDVAAYIEQLTNQHTEALQALRNELKASAAQNITLKEQLDSLTEAKADLETQVEELIARSQDRDSLAAALQTAQDEKAQLSSELRDAKDAVSSLREAQTKLETRLRHYTELEQELNKSKEHIADLELDALRRAAEMEDAARVRMQEDEARHRAEMARQNEEFTAYREQQYAEAAALVTDISSAYLRVKSAVGAFKTGFKQVVSDLAREIDTISGACDMVEQSFGELCQKCADMREQAPQDDSEADTQGEE